jgi:hypothetical protein
MWWYLRLTKVALMESSTRACRHSSRPDLVIPWRVARQQSPDQPSVGARVSPGKHQHNHLYTRTITPCLAPFFLPCDAFENAIDTQPTGDIPPTDSPEDPSFFWLIRLKRARRGVHGFFEA